VIPTGIDHGTVTVMIAKKGYEITTLRGERGYSDGRHPDEVFFVRDIQADLARRDFTVNAIAYDLSRGELVDPFGGREDLRRRVLRAVGDPEMRFTEDGLRVMRCARFCSTLELEVDEETRRAMRSALTSLEKVAVERIRDEWFKALASRRPSRALHLMRSEGVLESIAPELLSLRECSPDAFEAVCHKLDRAAHDPLRRLALLCCLGMPEAHLASQAADLGRRLKLSSQQRKRLEKLTAVCRPPALPRAKSTTESAESTSEALIDFRRWLCAVGRDDLEDVLTLLSELGEESRRPGEIRRVAQQELANRLPLSVKELAVSGSDLMQALGRAPGPWVGSVLSQLLERALRDPSINRRDRLLALAAEADES
jgi:tRNA nucleotidyltransferase (CCA-adding enzyme)